MKRYVVLMTAVAVALALAIPAGAESAAEVLDRDISVALDRTAVNIANKPAPNLDDIVEVFVQLDAPSVSEFVASSSRTPSSSAQKGQARKVDQQQASFRRQLEKFKVTELFSLQIGANGLTINAPLRDVIEIAKLPGVVSVAPVAKHYPTNASSVPWIEAPAVWASGYTGAGISIAVIDTGVDYYHDDFGGAGAAAYAADNPEIIEPGSFPTAKVIDGYDFAGTSYDASGDIGPTTPSPDPDPLGVHYHGTHVAGSAAGFGTATIGAGVAPDALIYAYKVFGDAAGSTNLTALAIERALDPNDDGDTSDHVDVINMSLGSDFGSPLDPSAISSQNASELGIIVVASAGNDGNVDYVTGAPAVADGVISVAASADGGLTVLGITVNSPVALKGLYEAAEAAFTPKLTTVGPVTGNLVLADPLLACGSLANAGAISGNIAMIRRGTCAFVDKIANAQAAGARAVLVYNHTGDAIVMGGSGTFGIPAVMISRSDGDIIAAAITGGATVNVTLAGDIVIPKPELADTLAGFTSRGPGAGTTFKPDVSAPGSAVESANAGGGSTVASGTSMAAPHVAGLAALLRQQHPTLPVDAIKSLIMNGAVPANGAYPIARQGTGVVRASASSALGAYTSPAGVSFGYMNPLTAGSEIRTVTVTDIDGSEETYAISVDSLNTPAGVSVSAPAEVTVPKDGSAVFDITISYDPALMDHDDGFYSQTEVDGWVRLTNDSETLSVGFMGAIDPASAVSASDATPGKGQSLMMTVGNPSDTVGWLESFTLTGEGAGSMAALGIRANQILDTIDFGVASPVVWDALSIRETDILIDTDEDSDFEYALVAADLGYLTGGSADGRVVTALFDLVHGGGFLEWFVVGDHNDQVQILSVDRYGPYGFLEEGNLDFDYVALGYDLRFGLDGIQTGSVDLSNEVSGHSNVVFGGIGPLSETTVLVAPATRGDMLWLYQNNAAGEQYQIYDHTSAKGKK